MSSFSHLVDSLDVKVRKLLEEKNDLQKQLNELQEKVETLQGDNASLAEQNEELTEKNKILKIAGGASEGDRKEMKLKINEIVREVDKCIAQLNQ